MGVIVLIIFFAITVIFSEILKTGDLWEDMKQNGYNSSYYSLVLYRLSINLFPAFIIWRIKIFKLSFIQSLNFQFASYLLLKAVLYLFAFDYLFSIDIMNSTDSYILIFGYIITFFTKQKISLGEFSFGDK